MSTDLATHDVMAQALHERGILTADQVAQSRAALEAQINGTPPAETAASPNPASPNALTDQSPVTPSIDGTLDAAVFAPPQSLTAYQFATGPAPEGAEHSLEFEQANRAALFEAGIPTSIGSQMAALWDKAMATDLPTPQQIEQGRQEGMAALAKAWGQDFDQNLALARSVVVQMQAKQPAIMEMLEESGLGNNVWLTQTLANIGRARGLK